MADSLPLPPKRRRPRVVNVSHRIKRLPTPKTRKSPNPRALERANKNASFKRISGAAVTKAKRGTKLPVGTPSTMPVKVPVKGSWGDIKPGSALPKGKVAQPMSKLPKPPKQTLKSVSSYAKMAKPRRRPTGG